MRAKFYIYQPWLTLVARLILGGVLLAAGGLKIGNLQKSAMAVRAYEMLPVGLANFLGYVLPWVEIGIGLLLIVGVAVAISGLLGALDPEDTKYLSEIIRDIGLLVLGIYLYYFPKGKFGLDK
jgi:uncharacterized membrane protein YphA (DoxX/SURF4 family)